MKTITVLIFASIIVFACSKKDDEKGDGYPGVFNLYFDLKKSDGTPFEQGEVFFPNSMKLMENFIALLKDGKY